jgi:hypothetical protein
MPSHFQGHSAAGMVMSMENSNDTIGNRTCNLPACSAVPEPTAPTYASSKKCCSGLEYCCADLKPPVPSLLEPQHHIMLVCFFVP